MPSELANLFHDLDPGSLRVSQPEKFIFFCGGEVSSDTSSKPKNLRDYLCRVRPIRTDYRIVLAEDATQLYRDTTYRDLISFEEDIAALASVVLVIAESAGALAELGAFSSTAAIRRQLRIIVRDEYVNANSFVRWGPIRRIENDNREHIGVYPWRCNKDGTLVISSAKPHYREIKNFIDRHVEKSDRSTTFSRLGSASIFYVIYWIVHTCLAISPAVLYDYVRETHGEISDSEIKNKMYCLILAGWVTKFDYASKDYYCARHNADPFIKYGFKAGVTDIDSPRRKMSVSKDHRKNVEDLPRYVRKKAADVRESNQ